MALNYLAKNSRLYQSASGSKTITIMIYGEEVETLGLEQNDRSKVRFRGDIGWVNKRDLKNDPVLEIYFIDVGQGDSTFLVTPARKRILVDGGTSDRAFRFLSWKYRLDQLNETSPIIIDLLVLTHADEDHIGGLIDVISSPKIKIKKIIHSGLAVYKDGIFGERLGNLEEHHGKQFISTSHNAIEELDDSSLSGNFLKWKKAILADGNLQYQAVDSNSGNINVGDPDITVEVLGPKVNILESNNTKLFEWFGDHSHTINGHSVVLRITYNNVKVLLSGDVNREGGKHIYQDEGLRNRMDAHVLKAPHHGRHEFYRPLLDAVNPQISVISSGDDRDHGHPRAIFLGAVGNASRKDALIFSTEIAANFVEVDKGLESTSQAEISQPTPRELFKRRLHGMINVRTDGEQIYAARRVAAAYMWEYYGTHPKVRSIRQ
jgi:beta-lactamase superfamily II metal-dependent hydrolase